MEFAKCGFSRLETKTVTIEERPERRLEAKLLTTYPVLATASATFLRVSSLTFSGYERARDTVMGETPATRATSSTRTGRFVYLLSLAAKKSPDFQCCSALGYGTSKPQ